MSKNGLIFAAITTIALFLMIGCTDNSSKSVPEVKAPKQTKADEEKPVSELDAQTNQAKAAIKSLGTQLKQELQAAFKQGGAINAVGVCKLKAPAIAKAVSNSGMQVGRVSLKNRSPGNVPLEWQKVVLEQFEKKKASGEAVDKLMYREIVKTDNGREFRMMKAIPTGNLCIVCHGETLDKGLVAKLDDLYPEDKARGFKKGDIRGAFWVTNKLK